MAKKMLIDATHAEETRVVVVDGNRVDEFDFESHSKRQLTGNIYLAKVTRVEPSLQAAFVEYGGNRHGFLAFSEIHPDYYQIPREDREALLAEEAAFARAEEEEATREKPKSRSRSRRKSSASAAARATAEDAILAETPETSPEAQDETGPENSPENGSGSGNDGADESDRLEDVPPPSAAAGDIEIDVIEEPEGDNDADGDAEGEGDAPRTARGKSDPNGAEENGGGYEQVGGDDVDEERRSQRARPMRRYKIQEVIKVRQILLVQVVKEERGNKGAALTTYLSLAGRYCVLMPNTARGGGISRKITQAADRKKLKDIASSLTVPEGAGLIIRTAGANRTKTEIKRDYEYLMRQWEVIRDLTLKSIAPCLIYEEGSLIKRAIRDLYSRDIDEILIDGERGYREAKDYMKMLMPSHAKNVKHYAEPLPLYSRYQVEGYLAAMFNPVVQLKSGGYIVIDVTEALVAIDVNSGRATREANVEETALKTNLEAAEEAARQMRLRDLAGLIVIDFIDMDERKNNAAVEKRLKEKLKTDRARIQVGRISAFGLLEMSRQRLRPGMIEATTKGCPHCHGTGRVRSDDSMALAMLRELEEEGVRQRSKEVLIACPVDIANYLLNQKREHVALIEARFGLSVRIEGDPSLISPDYRVERFKTASRIINVPQPVLPAVSIADLDEDEEIEAEATDAEEAEETPRARGTAEAEGDRGGRRRRRRRRRGGRDRNGDGQPGEGQSAEGEAAEGQSTEVDADADAEAGPEPATEPAAEPVLAESPAEDEAPSGRRRSRRRPRKSDAAEAVPAADATTPEAEGAPAPTPSPTPARAPAASPFDEVIGAADEAAAAPAIVEVPESGVSAPARPRRRERVRKPAVAVLGEVPGAEAAPQPEAAPADAPASAPAEPAVSEPAAETATTDDGFHPATWGETAPEAAPEPPAEPASAAGPEAPSEPEAAEPEAPRPETPETEATEREPEPAAAGPDAKPEAEADRPRRRGWWSRALGGS